MQGYQLRNVTSRLQPRDNRQLDMFAPETRRFFPIAPR